MKKILFLLTVSIASFAVEAQTCIPRFQDGPYGAHVTLTPQEGAAPYEISVNGMEWTQELSFFAIYGRSYRILLRDQNGLAGEIGITRSEYYRTHYDPANLEITEQEIFIYGAAFIVQDGQVVPLTGDTVIARPNHGQLRVVQDPLAMIDSLLVFDTVYDTVSVVKIDPVGAEISFSHYPNPTTGKIIVEADEEVLRIDVFDYTGRNVATFVNTNKIDISRLPSGVYALYLTFKDGKTVPPCEIIKN